MIVSNVNLSCTEGNSAWCVSNNDGNVEAPSNNDLTPTGHLIVAVCLGIIGSLGFSSNLLVLLLFCRYKVLRSPINLLLMNISVSDMLVCAVGTPFSFAASTQGRWLIGKSGCVWYGFVNSCLGMVSLISLAVLSYERYSTMMGSTEADATNYRKIGVGIMLSWGYSLLWTLPPLFGWSSYGPEGPGTTCSVNWKAKDVNNISYIVCLFVFCLVLPFFVIIYSYGKLLLTVKQVSVISTVVGRSREQRILFMVLAMVICFLLCWLPYGIVALLATFGKSGLVTPEASIIPSLLAKSSTVFNPIIYIFLNKQFYRCFRAFLMCQRPANGSSVRSSSKTTKPCRAARRAINDNRNFVVTSAGRHSTLIQNRTDSVGERGSSWDASKPPVLLVAHYNG
ncbi:teleost multiple tissue opsin b isoform X1 [Lepisosteus oculatus]|uniref:teleost multiple tissue opsin b isoform X1 n=1 Tax=Lepisosteus oculatus TaxID=7918 RepID=UPI0035F5188E